MIALVLIWGFAALLGYAVHAAYEPVLSVALTFARTVDPGIAVWLAEIGGTPALRDVASWGVAILVGGVLTLGWLALRVVGRTARAVRRDGTPAGFGGSAPRRETRTAPESWQLDPNAPDRGKASGPAGRPVTPEPAAPERTPTVREAKRFGSTQRWGRE